MIWHVFTRLTGGLVSIPEARILFKEDDEINGVECLQVHTEMGVFTCSGSVEDDSEETNKLSFEYPEVCQ